MSGTTTNLHLPYPTDVDYLTNGDEAIEALAQALDGGAAGAPVAGTNITPGAATLVYRRSGVGLLLLEGVTAGAAIAATAVILTLPAGYRPAVNWRGLVQNYTTTTGLLLQINTNGTVQCVQAIASGNQLYGSVAFPLAPT